MRAKEYFWLACALAVLILAVSSAGFIDKATVALNVPVACTAVPVDTVITKKPRWPRPGDPMCKSCMPSNIAGPIPDSLRVR